MKIDGNFNNHQSPGRVMKQMITIYKRAFFLTIIIGLLAVPAQAKSSWQWKMTLADNLKGDAMYMPAAVSFDQESGRYYAVDAGNNRLISFDRNGVLLKAFSAENRLKAPFDMVRLDDGKLWVVEKGRNSLTLIDIAGKKVVPNTLKDEGRLVFPDRLVESNDKLYVLDRASGQVLQLNDDLSVAQRFGCADCLGVIVDFAVDDGSVWTLDVMGKNIYHYAADGKLSDTLSLGDRVNFPDSLAISPGAHLIYVLDRHQGQVVVFGEDGKYQYSFLGLGQGQEQLYFPRQIRFDPWGHLCVVDEGNGRIIVYAR